MDTDEHKLSDIIEIISPELNGAPFQPHTAPHSAPPTRTSPQKPYIRIVVQPTKDDVRFRYESEGRSAGSIPGDAKAQDSSSFPTVEVVGYNGEAIMVASCVTNDEPYRPHPHKLVGKDCKDGVCTKRLRAGQPLRFEFSGVGIQCARRKDVQDSLTERQLKDVDPFRTGFEHKNNPIELNKVRLCFQAYMRTVNNRWEGLTPVVSDTLFDRKANNDLKINRLCSCSATVDGGDEIILLCEKVKADNIKVRFKATVNDAEVWHAYADFEPTHVHKQTAIAFRTPRFPKSEYPEHVKTFIELERPSDGAISKALEFEFHYGPDYLKHKRRKMNAQRFAQLSNYGELASAPKQTYTTSKNSMLNIPPSFYPTDVKNEPNFINLSPPPQQQAQAPQQFFDYRNNYPVSPPSQPLSPINRNTTPSPNCLSAGKHQQIYNLLNNDMQSSNCRLENVVTYVGKVVNGGTQNISPPQVDYLTPSAQKADFVINHLNIAPTMSGGSISPLSNVFANNMQLQSPNAVQYASPMGQNHLSESAEIEQIVLSLMGNNIAQ